MTIGIIFSNIQSHSILKAEISKDLEAQISSETRICGFVSGWTESSFCQSSPCS